MPTSTTFLSCQRLHEPRAAQLVAKMQIEGVCVRASHVARDFDASASGLAKHLFGSLDHRATDASMLMAWVDDQRANPSNRFRSMQNDGVVQRGRSDEFAVRAVDHETDIAGRVPGMPSGLDLVFAGGMPERGEQSSELARVLLACGSDGKRIHSTHCDTQSLNADAYRTAPLTPSRAFGTNSSAMNDSGGNAVFNAAARSLEKPNLE